MLLTLISFAIRANSLYYVFLSRIDFTLSSISVCFVIIRIFSNCLCHFCLSKLRFVSWSLRYSLYWRLIMSNYLSRSIYDLLFSALSIFSWIVSVNSLVSCSFMLWTYIMVCCHWPSFIANRSFSCNFCSFINLVIYLSRLLAPITKSLRTSYSRLSLISDFLIYTYWIFCASRDAPSLLLLTDTIYLSLERFQLYSIC